MGPMICIQTTHYKRITFHCTKNVAIIAEDYMHIYVQFCSINVLQHVHLTFKQGIETILEMSFSFGGEISVSEKMPQAFPPRPV